MGIVQLTIPQQRVLAFLAESDGWVPLHQLEHSTLLQPDDIVVVPSLVALGLIEHNYSLNTVRICKPHTSTD